jgi:predicted TIM-barrel fold metal-dependent hydrolase
MSEPICRRTFVQASAALVLTASVPIQAGEKSESLRDSPTKKSPVVDTHLHCFAGKDDKRFPYHARAPYRPDAPATPQRLLELMGKAGVDFAIVVHPEPYQDDHRYLEYCLDVGKKRLKGTALVFADRPGSVEKLPALVKRLPIVAVRIHAYAPDRLPPFGKPELKALWKKATDLGLAVQLHLEPRHAPGFESLIKEFAGTTVIIDHLGRPFQGTPKEHAVVVNWSRFKNTVMKLSAIPSERSYPHRDVKPVVRRLVDAYGPDRLIYGGGFNATATAESYRAAREQVRSLISHLSASDQAKVLGGNAAKLFGFGSG